MSGVYIGVDGKARKVKGGYIGVDGKARKIKKGYIGDENGVARLCWNESVKKLSEYTVGSSVYLLENGNPVEYLIVHKGIPSNLYDSSCDGAWLLRKDILELRSWNESNNSNIYATSSIHNYLNSEFLSKFDVSLQNAVKQVKIPYTNGYGNSGVVASGANGLTTKAFLLAVNEVGLTVSDYTNVPSDGYKLDYFESGTVSTAKTKRTAYLDGVASVWWTRSAYKSNATDACRISDNGGLGSLQTSRTGGIRPALILPYNAIFDETTNIFEGVTK